MYSESDSTPMARQSRPEDWGRVVAVRGSVVDVAFAEHDLPDIHEAVEIKWDQPGRPVAEVQQHLDPATVRTVALGGTAELRRGTAVYRTRAPISVPVGEAVLGRLVDALGEPGDHGPPFGPAVPRWPIHRPAPRLADQSPQRELFETGIKVIDLLAPLAQGGKAAMFGGAGVGKTVLVMELIHAMVANTTASRSSPASASARAKGTNCLTEMQSSGVLDRTVLVYRPDERAAGRALAGTADRADHRRIFSRPEASERAAADG